MSRLRKGFALPEVLVVLAIVALLAGLLLPAVQRVREAASRVSCANNLKQIGLALHQYEQINGSFPANRWACGATWAVLILPYLEQDNLHQQWDFDRPYFDQPEEIRGTNVASYFCPSRRESFSAPRVSVSGDENQAGIHFPGGLGDYAFNLGPSRLPDELDDVYLRPQAATSPGGGVHGGGPGHAENGHERKKKKNTPLRKIELMDDGMVLVPDVRDRTPPAAQALIEQFDLVMQGETPFEGKLYGKAARQQPPARSRVPRGSKVIVEFIVTVPNLIDEGFAQARQLAKKDGLLLIPFGDDEFGMVIDQTPKAGVVVNPGSKVSANFAIRVPKVKKDSYLRAESSLTGRSLRQHATTQNRFNLSAKCKTPWGAWFVTCAPLRGEIFAKGLVLEEEIAVVPLVDRSVYLQDPTAAQREQHRLALVQLLQFGATVKMTPNVRVPELITITDLNNVFAKPLVQSVMDNTVMTKNDLWIEKGLLYPQGRVISQSPAPGTIVPRNTIVHTVFEPPPLTKKKSLPQGPRSGSPKNAGGWGFSSHQDPLGAPRHSARHRGRPNTKHHHRAHLSHLRNLLQQTRDPHVRAMLEAAEREWLEELENCPAAETQNASLPYDQVDLKVVQVTDGMSNSFLIGEKHVPVGSFGKGGWDSSLYNGTGFSSSGRAAGPSFDLAVSVHDPAWKFGSYHPGVCQFLFADGTVRTLSAGLDPVVLGRLAHHSDGHVIPSLE